MSISLCATPSSRATSDALVTSRLCAWPYWNVIAVSRSHRGFA